jgi:hypothetical protein
MTATAYLPPELPSPRGPISEWLFDQLMDTGVTDVAPAPTWPMLGDDDAQLALYCCYELHYRGFRGVDANVEWSPEVLALRAELERAFVGELALKVGGVGDLSPATVEEELLAIAGRTDGPSLSRLVQDEADLDRVRELCIHRSAYQLKEADPHTWCIPRVWGECKAAMVEIQTDEYGGGLASAMHAELFADTLRSLDLDATYGAYLDRLPGVTLATTNLISLFGLHRRWRGALVGHLAMFEMTSVGPMGRYADAMTRVGVSEGGRRFYEVHVQADVEHQRIALERMVRGLLASEPDLARDVVFGARSLGAIESRFASHLLSSWQAGRSSLLEPQPPKLRLVPGMSALA